VTAKIHHFDLYGSRQSKYDTLLSSSLKSLDWQDLAPNAPHYLFMPQEQAFRQEYEAGWAITAIFPINVLGFQTHRDPLAIAFSEKEMRERIEDVRNGTTPNKELSEKYKLGTWSIDQARAKLASDEQSASRTTKCLYRPFDVRYWYPSTIVTDRPRPEILKNIVDKQNLALNITRQTRSESWQHALVSNLPTPALFVEIKDGSNVFPLWRYPTEQEAAMGIEREANIAPAFITELQQRIGETPKPEDIFHYVYAVFHAPTYRTRYAAFLKTDFPRLPLPPDADAFHALAALGAKLTALHLLEAPELKQHGIGFPVSGDHTVKKMRPADRYVPPTPGGQSGRVKLNDTEYFEGVSAEAWEFQVGGYRPAAKWLDDRQGRLLSADDITHYRHMIAAMRATAALLPQVDAAFLPVITRRPAEDIVS
jgi:predicted helicase